jgi:hypothetical protein
LGEKIMGWSYGHDKNGREVGDSVEAKCDHDGCDKKIDRGLSYRCGGVKGLHEDSYGCGGFFCHEHLHVWCPDQLCPNCYEDFEKENPNYGEDDEMEDYTKRKPE